MTPRRYVRRLRWKSAPLTLIESIWKKRAESGDLESLQYFLMSRTLDENDVILTLTEDEVFIACHDIAAAIGQDGGLIAENGLH